MACIGPDGNLDLQKIEELKKTFAEDTKIEGSMAQRAMNDVLNGVLPPESVMTGDWEGHGMTVRRDWRPGENPQEQEFAQMMKWHRKQCDTPELRLETAVNIKTKANEVFTSDTKEEPTVVASQAMIGYLQAIWQLQRGDPPIQPVLCSQNKPNGSEAMRVLGHGDPRFPLFTGGEVSEETAAKIFATQQSLHLNVARTALVLHEWPLARAACDVVLDHEPNDAKALYRLAKAHEGEGDYTRALQTLSQLVKGHPQNAEGRKLLSALKRQVESQKESLGGLFERARQVDKDGEGLYKEKELMPQRAEERAKKKKALENPEILTEGHVEYHGAEKSAGMVTQFTTKYELEADADKELKESLDQLLPEERMRMKDAYKAGMEPAKFREEFVAAFKRTTEAQDEYKKAMRKESWEWWCATGFPRLGAFGVVVWAWSYRRYLSTAVYAQLAGLAPF